MCRHHSWHSRRACCIRKHNGRGFKTTEHYVSDRIILSFERVVELSKLKMFHSVCLGECINLLGAHDMYQISINYTTAKMLCATLTLNWSRLQNLVHDVLLRLDPVCRAGAVEFRPGGLDGVLRQAPGRLQRADASGHLALGRRLVVADVRVASLLNGARTRNPSLNNYEKETK
jgi:hypothetical protein